MFMLPVEKDCCGTGLGEELPVNVVSGLRVGVPVAVVGRTAVRRSGELFADCNCGLVGGELYGLSLASMNARLMGVSASGVDSVGTGALAGNSEGSILIALLSPAVDGRTS